MTQTKQKPHFGPDLDPLGPNPSSNSYYLKKKCMSFIPINTLLRFYSPIYFLSNYPAVCRVRIFC